MVIMVTSRLLALLSSQIYMSHFGTDGIYINIYSYVINIPNIIFTCIGTALSTVVIPIYVGHKARGDKDKAKLFADNIITVSTVLTLVLVILGILLSPFLIKLTGFSKDVKTSSYSQKALMMVMPVMFFYAWNYIFQGMLQSEGRYKLPAFVSVPSSLVVILYVIFLGDKFGVTGLLIATIIGLSLQAFILIPPLYKCGYRYNVCFNLKDADIIKSAKMTLPVLLGVGAYQLNMLFNSTFVARLDASSVTIFTFVQNITIQLVLAFVYSFTAVIYPKLSESVAKGDMDGYKHTLNVILKTVCVIMIPLTFGYISMREPLLNLLVLWGKVTPDTIKKAEIFLSLYALSITSIGLKEILDRAFYSLENTKTSAINGLLIMIVNIGAGLLLMQKLNVYAIPLAYSMASIIGILNLLYRLKRKVGTYAKGLGIEIIKSLIASACMFLVVSFVNYVLKDHLIIDNLTFRLIKVFIGAISGVISYYILGYLLKIEIISTFTGTLFKKIKR